jgi:hypothetical protein
VNHLINAKRNALIDQEAAYRFHGMMEVIQTLHKLTVRFQKILKTAAKVVEAVLELQMLTTG